MSEASASPKRPRLEFDDSAKEDHNDRYKNRDQDDQGSYSNSRKRRGDTDDDDMKECDEIKSKSVGMDAGRREHTLVMRLTTKEQELQECMNQIQEMKQAQTQNTAQLRSMLLDPAINLVFQRMSKEMDEHKEKLKQKQNELNAWKFTPDSQTGMRLMVKCRMLLQENGELGKIISTGRTAKLEGEISLHKALVGEMKKNQKELDEFVGELEEDVEGMQGMIFMLQQQLKEAREQITRLQQENEQLRTLQLPTEPDPGGAVIGGLDADGKLSLSSPPQCVTFSHKSPDHQPQAKSSTTTTTSLLHVSNTLVPQTDSGDSALTSGSCGDLSPGSVSLKVTPDSGVQTQEEEDDDPTDSPSVDDLCAARLNSIHRGDGHTSPTPPPPQQQQQSSHRTDESHLEDGERTPVSISNSHATEEGNGRTSACDGIEEDEEEEKDKSTTTNHSIPDLSVHDLGVHDSGVPENERTSSPTAGVVENTNGDILMSTNEDSDSLDNGLERTRVIKEEVESECLDNEAGEEGEKKVELTPSSGGDGGGEVMEESTKCVVSVSLEPESVAVVNSIMKVPSNLTNGSTEEEEKEAEEEVVTGEGSSMETD